MSAWTWSAAEILLNAAWIGCLASAAAWALCRLPGAGPRLRAAICLAALAAAAALPPAQRILRETHWPEAVSPPSRLTPAAFPEPVPAIAPPRPVSPPAAAGVWQVEAGPLGEALVRLWLLGALAGAAYLAYGLLAALQLKRDARAARGDWAARERRWTRLGGRKTRLLLTDAIGAPVAVGWLRPVVLFPPALAATLSEEELERLWLHEAAHLERRDDWLVALEKLSLALLWFHPAAWALARRVSLEREMACDALAAERSGSRREYARTLTRLAELRIARSVAPALAIAGATSLSRRIEMLLHDRPVRPGRLGRTGLTLASAACAAAAAGVLAIGPLIGLAQSPPPAPPAPAAPAASAALPAPPAPAAPPVPVAAAAPQAAPASKPSPAAPKPFPAPPAPAVPMAAPAPQAVPAPKPFLAPSPAVAPVPPVPPQVHDDPEFREDMRAFSEEMREMSEEIRAEVEQNMRPFQEKMHALADQMRAKNKPFAEAMQRLSREVAELHMKSQLSAEDERQLEAKMAHLDEVAQQMEQSMKGLEEKMRQLEIEAKPDETKLRELQQRMEEKSRELERRMEQRFERRESTRP